MVLETARWACNVDQSLAHSHDALTQHRAYRARASMSFVPRFDRCSAFTSSQLVRRPHRVPRISHYGEHEPIPLLPVVLRLTLRGHLFPL
jgi:hypothetical protein